jgi:CheY-like chemotaxis protein
MQKMHKKILIVDDHDDLSTALTSEFSKDGYLVKAVESRDEAIALIENRDFDLIISDLDGEHLIATEPDEIDDEIICLPDPSAIPAVISKPSKSAFPTIKTTNSPKKN